MTYEKIYHKGLLVGKIRKKLSDLHHIFETFGEI